MTSGTRLPLQEKGRLGEQEDCSLKNRADLQRPCTKYACNTADGHMTKPARAAKTAMGQN